MTHATSSIDPSRSSVLLLGGKEYPSSRLPSVPAVEHNLAELKKAFEDPALWGMSRTAVTTYCDLVRNDIFEAVRRSFQGSERDGVFVLYFAGHAQYHRRDGKLYLAPHDTTDIVNPQDSMVPVDAIFAATPHGGGADKKLLVLDCCYAGGAIGSAPQEASPASGGSGGWYVMAATAKSQEALGEPTRRTTLFTGALLKAFEGVVDDRPTLSPRWVFDAVSDIVKNTEEVSKEKRARLIPNQSSAPPWADGPWLRNPQHVPPPPVPYQYPSLTPATASPQPLLPNDFHELTSSDEFFVGREKELESARKRFGKRAVLPVYGPRYAGKSAFVRRLLSTLATQEPAPEGKPWLLLEITIPNSSAESPVLEGLTRALEIGLQDIDQHTDTEGDPRREAVIGQLQGYARGRTLILQIDCGSLGYDPKKVSGELDQLLGHPYFRNTANIVVSRVRVPLYQDEQLDVKPSVRLKELQRPEAVELLVELMADEGVEVDGASVLDRVQDRRLRLPGVLVQSANGYLESFDLATSAPDPEEVATALIEGTAPRTAKTLLGLGCRLSPVAPERPEPLAVLSVWALVDQLPLPEHMLRSSALAFPPRVLSGLKDAHIVHDDGSGHFTLGQTSRQALRTLLIAALTREEPGEDPEPVSTVGPADLDGLFPFELGPEEIDQRLSTTAKILLTATGVQSTDANADTSDTAVQMRLRSALGWIEEEGHERLPLLHDVIRTFVWAPAGDALYSPTSTDSLASPPTMDARPSDLPDAVEPVSSPVGDASLTWLYRLVHSGASLNLTARAEDSAAEISERYVAAAQEFSEVLSHGDPEQTPHTLVRSADASLTVTGRRLGLQGRLLGVRLATVDMLLTGARLPGPGQAGRITLAISWMLNTADGLIDADRLDEAQDLVDRADELVSHELPHDGTVRSTHSRHQIHSRIARVRSRVLQDPAQSRRELLRAVLSAVDGLRLAHTEGEPLTLWSIRLLDLGLLLMQQSSSDDELIETRDLVMEALEGTWGESRSWPASLCIPVARFLRRVHVRCNDSDLKLRGAEQAVALLKQLPVELPEEAVTGPGAATLPSTEPENHVATLSAQNDAKVLSALAQAYGFLFRALQENQHAGKARSRLTRARDYAYGAVVLAPTPFSYLVWLRQVTDLHRSSPQVGPLREETEKHLRAALRRTRRWLAREDSRSLPHALLHLNCLRYEWIQEGSLRGALRKTEEELHWQSPDVLLDEIRRIYDQRKKKLQRHRHQYGPSIELCAMEARLEREYCRWKCVLVFKSEKRKKRKGRGPGPATKRPQVDNGPVFNIFRKAGRRWPGEARLLAAEADFRRYIWHHGRAIELYEYLARTAPNGEVRRTARLSAAEAMLAELENSTPDLRSDWYDQLERAQEHLDVVLGPDSQIGLALVLRARIAIRLNQPVNWEPIDTAFEAIVGRDYAGTVGRFLDRRHRTKGSAPDGLGEMERVLQSREADSSTYKPFQRFFEEHYEDPVSDQDDGGISRSGDSGPSPNLGETYTGERGEEAGQFTADLLGEMLLTDFTSKKLLHGFGRLYLDRASALIEEHLKAHGEEPAADSETALTAAKYARQAYDCFDACRILQEAHGNESIVTKFQRGRAITLAARYVRDPDPFPHALPEERNRARQIHQAFHLIAAAREHSVGGFNKVCSVWASTNNETQTLLGLKKPQARVRRSADTSSRPRT